VARLVPTEPGAFPELSKSGVRLRALSARTLLRLQAHASTSWGTSQPSFSGFELPGTPGHFAGSDPALCWLAPHDWLIVSAASIVPSDVTGSFSNVNGPLAVTDLSDALVSFELQGAHAPTILQQCTGLDIEAFAATPSPCTRTRLCQLIVLLRCPEPGIFELIADRAPSSWLYSYIGSICDNGQ
jgi:heterotetrameric sarcosine oxidase gamma subunit